MKVHYNLHLKELDIYYVYNNIPKHYHDALNLMIRFNKNSIEKNNFMELCLIMVSGLKYSLKLIIYIISN